MGAHRIGYWKEREKLPQRKEYHKKRKRYFAEYYLKHKKDKPKVRIKLTPEERKIKKKYWAHISGVRMRAKRKIIKITNLGDYCNICSLPYENGKKIKMISHKKDCEPHKKFSNMTNEEFKHAMESGDYVLLCSLCHKRTHWAYDFLGLGWKDIKKKIKKKIKKSA
jgi:hypothetical protein